MGNGRVQIQIWVCLQNSTGEECERNTSWGRGPVAGEMVGRQIATGRGGWKEKPRDIRRVKGVGVVWVWFAQWTHGRRNEGRGQKAAWAITT